jgi:hypothetical protein
MLEFYLFSEILGEFSGNYLSSSWRGIVSAGGYRFDAS